MTGGKPYVDFGNLGPILEKWSDLVQIRNTGIVGLLLTKTGYGGSDSARSKKPCKVTVNLDNL